MTARKIPPNRRSITGHVPSQMKPGMLAFESKLERDLHILLEFDPEVRTVADQPLGISFVDGRGRLNKYTPDCEIQYVRSQRAPMLVEVKYRADLFRGWPDLHPKLRAATRFARNRGYGFRIITKREVHGQRLENARWLISYRSMPIPVAEVDQMVEVIGSLGGSSTPANLIERLTASVHRREELLVALWHAIAIKCLQIDLNAKLSMSSAIWVAQ